MVQELIKEKADRRQHLNVSFFEISILIFILTVEFGHQNNFTVPLELGLAIPLFLSSIFARTKLSYAKKPIMWDRFGFITFILGYSFLISAIGIILTSITNSYLGMMFFALNCLMAVSYSIFEVIEDKTKLSKRIFQDMTFIILIIIFGILPSLGIWNL
jgi:hypothetical protein